MKSINRCQIPQVRLVYTFNETLSERKVVTRSEDAFDVFFQSWDKETIDHHESFKVLLLNRGNNVLGIASISEGGTAGTVVDIKIIFQYALLSHASSIILAHNHPSGNLKPSDADIEITKKIKEAGQLFTINVLDHLILVNSSYYSMQDNGLIN